MKKKKRKVSAEGCQGVQDEPIKCAVVVSQLASENPCLKECDKSQYFPMTCGFCVNKILILAALTQH